jgi:hypothetical protein
VAARLGRVPYWACIGLAGLTSLLVVLVIVNWLKGGTDADTALFGVIVLGGLTVIVLGLGRAARYVLAGE